jgi:hypothetical protein
MTNDPRYQEFCARLNNQLTAACTGQFLGGPVNLPTTVQEAGGVGYTFDIEGGNQELGIVKIKLYGYLQPDGSIRWKTRKEVEEEHDGI